MVLRWGILEAFEGRRLKRFSGGKQGRGVRPCPLCPLLRLLPLPPHSSASLKVPSAGRSLAWTPRPKRWSEAPEEAAS